MKKLVLASTSPRRKELLEMVGLTFRTAKSNVDEVFNPRLSPKGQAESLSQQKAQAVANRYSDAIVLGADTIVSLGNEQFEKGENRENSTRLLQKLQGKTNLVTTSFTIIDTAANKSVTKSVETKVTLKKMSKKEIAWYVKTKEPFDKAGAYAAQGKGSLFIERIEGDYFNVVGLPISAVIDELKKFGVGVT
jgi:septum formation protein